jgi:DNA-binding beta-propeller fold protein YncE
MVVVYSASDLSYLQESTGPTGGLKQPSGLAQALGANGNIFVSSTATSNLYELDSLGNVVSTHSVASLIYQQLAVESSGKLYGASSLAGYVTRWDPSSSFTAKDMKPTGGSSSTPYGVAVDRRTGNVLATDDANGRVVAFSSTGDYLGAIISGLVPGNMVGVAVDATGNIYVPEWTDPGKLRKCDSSGKLLGVYGGAFRRPWNVVVRGGVVWVTQRSGTTIAGVHKITCFFLMALFSADNMLHILALSGVSVDNMLHILALSGVIRCHHLQRIAEHHARLPCTAGSFKATSCPSRCECLYHRSACVMQRCCLASNAAPATTPPARTGQRNDNMHVKQWNGERFLLCLLAYASQY